MEHYDSDEEKFYYSAPVEHVTVSLAVVYIITCLEVACVDEVLNVCGVYLSG